ncbi:LysE family translocator [Chloroflexia bacterium SDU3-3]|nr:LysE family translocator [Chloroflexia bacterium SDU3-3]
MNLLLQGLLIGFSIAAPVGPIGVLCIRRTLADGRTVGLATGLGAASADAVFGSVAAFGLAIISGFLMQQQTWIKLLGGAFLCYLGVRTLLSRPAEQAAQAGGSSLLGAYASTFFLTLTNPASIVLFSAVFASLGLFGGVGGMALLLVLGVFLGSALWWLLLSGGVSLLRSRFNAAAMLWVNRISGLIIFGFGAAALLSLLAR